MPMVAMRIPCCSPQRKIATAVARAATAVLTKVLPSTTIESSFSGRPIILATRSAPFTLVLTRCSTLIRCREIKAVSELEKKADKRKQTKRSTKYKISIPDICHYQALNFDTPVIFQLSSPEPNPKTLPDLPWSVEFFQFLILSFR